MKRLRWRCLFDPQKGERIRWSQREPGICFRQVFCRRLPLIFQAGRSFCLSAFTFLFLHLLPLFFAFGHGFAISVTYDGFSMDMTIEPNKSHRLWGQYTHHALQTLPGNVAGTQSGCPNHAFSHHLLCSGQLEELVTSLASWSKP